MEKTCPDGRCANWEEFRKGERPSNADSHVVRAKAQMSKNMTPTY